MSDERTQASEWAERATEVALLKERMARAYGVYGPGATIKLANKVVKPVSSQEEPGKTGHDNTK